MSDPDLETRIRSYYDRFAPDDSGPLVAAAQVRLEEARRPRPTRIIWGSLRLAATLAAAAVLLAVLVLPRSGPAAVPGSGTGSAPAGSPGPTFDAQTAMSAAIDKAGLMRSGGIWAVQGQYLLTSTDNGKTAALLKQKILPLCQYFAYIEVNKEGGRDFTTDLWRTYELLAKSGQPIAMRKVSERGQIYPVFRDLFAREQRPTQRAAYES